MLGTTFLLCTSIVNEELEDQHTKQSLVDIIVKKCANKIKNINKYSSVQYLFHI